MGDGEFGPSTKYRVSRKITQKLPHWTRRLPLLEVSRPYLLYIKDSFWNGFSSDTGETLVSGSIVCTGLLQGTVHLVHPPSSQVPSPLPLGTALPPVPRGTALPSLLAGLHSALSFVTRVLPPVLSAGAGENLTAH